MKSNVWEYTDTFNEMADIYKNLGANDKYIETLDNYESLLSDSVKHKSA